MALSTQRRHWPTEEHLFLTQRIRVSLTRGSRSELPQKQQLTYMARDTHFETAPHPITMRRPYVLSKTLHIYCLREYFSDV